MYKDVAPLGTFFHILTAKDQKLSNMIKFEHLRVAQAREKYIVFDKNGLPGEKHQETSP